MKGCPFNNFGPCREGECALHLDTEDANPIGGCVFHLTLRTTLAVQDSVLLTADVLTRDAPYCELPAPDRKRILEKIIELEEALADQMDFLRIFYALKPKRRNREKKKS